MGKVLPLLARDDFFGPYLAAKRIDANTATHPSWGGVTVTPPDLGLQSISKPSAQRHKDGPGILGGGVEIPALTGRLNRLG